MPDASYKGSASCQRNLAKVRSGLASYRPDSFVSSSAYCDRLQKLLCPVWSWVFLEFATAFCGERCYYKWEMVCVIFIRWPGFTGYQAREHWVWCPRCRENPGLWGRSPVAIPSEYNGTWGYRSLENGGLSTSLSFVRGYFLMPLWYWICRDCSCFFQWCCQSLILYDFMVVSFFQFHLKFYAYV